MSLYRKYRPDTLAKMVGNAAAVAKVESIMKKDEIPQAFLFTGPSGCGKTTMGRIAASMLGVDLQGADYVEMDSADFNGVDAMRNIRRNMRLAPVAGKRRVYLLDECHRVTKEAQAILLKALEDPPKHVTFILCTTDPQKLLGTVKNRCTHITVEPLKDDDMMSLLSRVCKRERSTVPDKVLEQIVDESCGSSRAALVVLESIIDLDEDDMMEAAKQKAIEESEAIELCRALFAKTPSWKTISGVLKKLEAEPEGVRQMVLAYTNTVLMKNMDERACIVLEAFIEPFYATPKHQLLLACVNVFHDA